MTKLIYKTGNLFESDAPAYGHGVNTVGRMGAGIAKLFRAEYPEMFEEYVARCKSGALQPGGLFGWIPPEGRTIYNIASQQNPGKDASLEWLGSGVMYALHDADSRGYDRIAIPRIGTGLGGLPWMPVQSTLRGLAQESKCDLEIWTLDE